MLRRAGVLDKIRQRGLSPYSMTWRRVDGSIINRLTGLNSNPNTGGFIMFPVNDLASFLREELCNLPAAKIYWNRTVATVGQDDTTAWVDCSDGTRFKADFVVGCDGATSIVRKSLFGRKFPGKTWDPIIVATNVCRSLLVTADMLTPVLCSCATISRSMVGQTCLGSLTQSIGLS